VLRILDRGDAALGTEHVGMSAHDRAHFDRILDMPHGIVLVTGPTGSGKTTTLYAALSKINDVERKIITVEDPVEYQLKGVNQIQDSTKTGLTFGAGLRAILRHDPDVVLVGEIRDHETAEIAVQASLTGHLVFSTLHTNDAPGAATRLVGMASLREDGWRMVREGRTTIDEVIRNTKHEEAGSRSARAGAAAADSGRPA